MAPRGAICTFTSSFRITHQEPASSSATRRETTRSLTLTETDPGLLSETDPPNLTDCVGLSVVAGISETVGPGRVGESEIQALEDEQPAFQGGAIDVLWFGDAVATRRCLVG